MPRMTAPNLISSGGTGETTATDESSSSSSSSQQQRKRPKISSRSSSVFMESTDDEAATNTDDDDDDNVLVDINESSLFLIIQQSHREVQQQRNKKSKKDLATALLESRDAVLAEAQKRNTNNNSNSNNKKDNVVVFPRIPSNTCPPLVPSFASSSSDIIATRNNNVTPTTDSPSSQSSIAIKLRQSKSSSSQNETIQIPPLYLEGAFPSRPLSSATIFLRGLLSIEDEENLTHVPYFGDDDKEDVVSELFDTEHREKMMDCGSEYQEKEMNEFLDDLLGILYRRVIMEDGADQYGTKKKKQQKKRKEALAELIKEKVVDLMDVFEERVSERWSKTVAKHQNAKDKSDAKTTQPLNDDDDDEDDTMIYCQVIQPSKSKSPPSSCEKQQSTNTETMKNSSAIKPIPYVDMMDSYRNLFCRRCFSYDCNMHGNITKADVTLQGELSVAKEVEGHWDAFNDDTSALFNTLKQKHQKRQQTTPPPPQSNMNNNTSKTLTPLQKSLCDRAFIAFRGNIPKIAQTLNAPIHLLTAYIHEQNITFDKAHIHVPLPLPKKQPVHKKRKSQFFTPDTNSSKLNNKHTSMKNYNQTWLKRVQDAVIHPLFIPCDHVGICSEENCSCVKNACFCTKHCAWGIRSKNFFRGCTCKGGRCSTKSCNCFAAKRECDPDLCKTCGCCSDPPNKPATKQLCRNDNIGMRRHCHLLLAESGIPDAGWGIYTKNSLKKGDFVHEYVGEVISQEEAERRGRIYDKVNRSYLFNLTSDYVVDASRKGNKTKFANHSSKPNCYTKLVSVNGTMRIGLFAQEDIEPQSELFFDYRYDVGIDNDLIHKPGMTVDWMKNPKMANQISKKYA